MTQFKFIHLIVIIALILGLGIGLLWFFHDLAPTPYPNKESYLLLLIYAIVLSSTAFIYKTNNLIYLHKQVGFNLFKSKYIIIAITLSSFIWVLDYYFQTRTMKINIATEAQEWIKNKNLIIAFSTTVIFAPLIEEMLFRGIFLQTINKYLSKFWTSLLVSSLFVLVHASLIDAPSLFIAATAYAWLTFKSKSIIPAIIAHILNNGLTFIYYLSLI